MFWLVISGLSQAFGQVVFSDTALSFGNVTTGVTHLATVTISNNYSRPVIITALPFDEEVFSCDLGSVQLNAGAQHNFIIAFRSEQNIDYTDFLMVTIDSVNKPVVIKVSASAIYPEAYYAATRNKWAEELKSALRDLIDGHTSLGYNTARDYMYGSIDNVNGWVECVYTGRKAQFSSRSGATANNFNCEHTWPQSFFSENEPMKSDLSHLYPTDETANSQRGSYDFGLVKTATWSVGGSKLGSDKDGLTVFDPRPQHQGNVARSHFYFTVRYNAQYVGYQNDTKMETILRGWHLSDTVDAAEKQRNEAIYTLQKNRNPFIDHPQLVERISSFFGTAQKSSQPALALSPVSVNILQVPVNSQAVSYLAIINSGQALLQVSSLASDQPQFSVSKATFSIPAESYLYLQVTFLSEDSAGITTGNLTLRCNDPYNAELIIPLRAETQLQTALDCDEFPAGSLMLRQNYPNPFNASTRINFELAEASVVTLGIYDVQGRLIRTLLSDKLLPAGDRQVTFNGEALPSGVYYYCLKSTNGLQTKRMVLIK
jgi:endonuclease I